MERYHVPTGRAVPGEDGGEAVAAALARLRPLLHAIAAAADEPRGPLPPDRPTPVRMGGPGGSNWLFLAR